jgi:alcohol dehydrogenase
MTDQVTKKHKVLPATMRAARYHAFGGPIAVEEVPVPRAAAGGVVLRVMATGVCRSDWHGWKGHGARH